MQQQKDDMGNKAARSEWALLFDHSYPPLNHSRRSKDRRRWSTRCGFGTEWSRWRRSAWRSSSASTSASIPRTSLNPTPAPDWNAGEFISINGEKEWSNEWSTAMDLYAREWSTAIDLYARVVYRYRSVHTWVFYWYGSLCASVVYSYGSLSTPVVYSWICAVCEWYGYVGAQVVYSFGSVRTRVVYRYISFLWI